MSDQVRIVKETLTYSDGSEKVVNFNPIGEEGVPEESVELEEALAATPEKDEVVEEEKVDEEVDEDEEVPESETEDSGISL